MGPNPTSFKVWSVVEIYQVVTEIFYSFPDTRIDVLERTSPVVIDKLFRSE